MAGGSGKQPVPPGGVHIEHAIRQITFLQSMEAHRTRVVVGENGSLALHDVPFQQGEEVEVIVLRPAWAEEKQQGASPEDEEQTVSQSGLAGLWKDRDLPDSPTYARQLREQAQNRPHLKDLGLGRDSS